MPVVKRPFSAGRESVHCPETQIALARSVQETWLQIAEHLARTMRVYPAIVAELQLDSTSENLRVLDAVEI